MRKVLNCSLFFVLATIVITGGVQAEGNIRQSYFTSFLPNYFGVSTEENEEHVEFLVSLKYPNLRAPKDERRGWEIFGVYSGLYDFYVNTRYSAPVVSRMQNVGLYFRKNYNSTDGWAEDLFGFDGLDLDVLDLTVSHESNGQSVSTIEEYTSLRNNTDDYIASNADDYVSMSTHYVGLEMKFRWDEMFGGLLDLVLRPQGRLVFHSSEYYFNDQPADVALNLRRYRAFRLIAELDIKGLPDVVYKYSLDNHEIQLSPFRILNVPLLIAAGTDNTNELSTYRTRSEYITVALNLDARLFND